MHTQLQEAIVTEIQKITNEDSDYVINIQALDFDPSDQRTLSIIQHLERVMSDRDNYALELVQDGENRENSHLSSLSINGDTPSKMSKNGSEIRSPSPNLSERHVNVELASVKAEVRRLRNENEEKDELLLELQDEVEQKEAEIARLQQERLDLVKDARAAKDYRDEVDCMQHKLVKLERLEAENEKLRTKLTEINFYKNRVNSLKEDNDVMNETCRVLEEQLEQCKKKLSSYNELESKLSESQNSSKNFQSDLSKERERIEQLLIENGRLERENKQHAQKYADLERRMEATAEFASPRELHDSLQSQMDACNRSQILELQLENKKLKSKLDNCVEPGEMFELRERLASAERAAEEKTQENMRLLSNLQARVLEKSKIDEQCTTLKTEREELQKNLQELKKNLSAAQVETQKQRDNEHLARKSKEIEQTLSSKIEEIETLKEEKFRIESQLEKMKNQQKEARIEIDDLKEELAKMESSYTIVERAKKILETERNTFKQKASNLEDKYNEINVKILNYENLERKLLMLEKSLIEKTTLISDIEAENRTYRQQMELETKKTQRLREDLISEKASKSDLLSRLRSVCAAIQTNGGKMNRSEEFLQDDQKLIQVIDDVIMQALNAAKREADSLRLQQQLQIAELDDLKRDVQNLRKAESELDENDDRVKDLIVENKNVKEQVTILQERLRKYQIEESTKMAELQASKREIEELQQKNLQLTHAKHSEIAKLQVTLRNVQLQEELLREDNAELRKQIELCVKARNDMQRNLESMEAIHNALAADHDRLQNLHQMLTVDYDRAKYELKQKSKNEKTTSDSQIRSEFAREKLHLEEKWRRERDEHQKDLKQLKDYENSLSELRKEKELLLQNGDERNEELRRLRLSDVNQKTTINSLNSTIQELNRSLTEKDQEINCLHRQIEVLRQYNGDESRALIKQIEMLLIQNQELHARSLNDKDAFYQQQRELQEKLVTLRRHKESLEQKIIDQYKAMDSRKIKEKPTFVKRAAKALIPRSPARKSVRNGTNGIIEKTPSGSTTEDSSIYSADEGGFSGSPPPLAANHGQSTCTTPNTNTTSSTSSTPSPPSKNVPSTTSTNTTVSRRDCRHSAICSSSEHDGSSPDYDIYHKKTGSYGSDSGSYASIIRNSLRPRNGIIGGSLRYTPNNLPNSRNGAIRLSSNIGLIEEDVVSLNGSERAVDVPTPIRDLPPRVPSHHSISSSKPPPPPPARAPVPPPYPAAAKPPAMPRLMHSSTNSSITSISSIRHPPPPYPGRIATPTGPFIPQETSTPKPHPQPSPTPSNQTTTRTNVLASVAAKLAIDREPEEIPDPEIRKEKAMSVYENVNGDTSSEPKKDGSTVWYEYGCV
uniref:Uncharacterized protein n=1 Tax=Acrobeloides nanus TaxID=290746 RepID=A0A914EP54_9BILA